MMINIMNPQCICGHDYRVVGSYVRELSGFYLRESSYITGKIVAIIDTIHRFNALNCPCNGTVNVPVNQWNNHETHTEE